MTLHRSSGPLRPFILAALLLAFGTHRGSPADAGWARDEDLPAEPWTAVEEERLRRTVEALPRHRAALGTDEARAGLRAAEAFVVARFRDLGDEPRLEPVEWAMHGGIDRRDAEDHPDRPPHLAPDGDAWHNVVVERRGTTRPEEIVLVGAHVDAVPGTPGADDNASGVAGVLEMARVLRDHPTDRTIRFVVFNLEEVGLVGARHHARLVAERDETIVGVVILEMIGYFSDEPGSQRSPVPPVPGVFEPPTVGDSIVLVSTAPHAGFTMRIANSMTGASPDLPVFPFAIVPGDGRLAPDIRRSDHAPFLDLGIPALMVTDTANFRNPHYHQPSDRVETLDLPRMTKVVVGATAAVLDLATVPADAKATVPAPEGAG